jgi:hypothetical protein
MEPANEWNGLDTPDRLHRPADGRILAQREMRSGAVIIVSVPFAKYTLITTDLPGAFGYAQNGQRAVNHGTRNVGLYTEFGGTSGAASLISGVAALMQRARRAADLPVLGGTQLRKVLTSACFIDRPVRPGIGTPRPDPMNMAMETHADLSEFFGLGLPDAMVAVGEALAYTK